MRSRISSKGQITVPVEVREKLGLKPGTPVVFELREGAAILKKGTGPVHPVDLVYGIAPYIESTDELLDAMRGPVPEDLRRKKTRR
ncbi:MAG TPA: AbrB/MazE/SpoVT family DNA-binding domain-containing protein [Candidatus Polarisedimenticolaceae bacterium]|nr:AbrB/MazE/SpoVT family DNA-binding domain-containing protein [Candidatus Polarisedimenticolaceae bacterium]